jgi:hypothetical protein
MCPSVGLGCKICRCCVLGGTGWMRLVGVWLRILHALKLFGGMD